MTKKSVTKKSIGISRYRFCVTQTETETEAETETDTQHKHRLRQRNCASKHAHTQRVSERVSE